MGSWSVYCGISQIAITSGHKCVLLPLNPQKYQHYTYQTHLPATLPIFGTYDDYGGLEDIEKDANTKLIEEHFKCSIEDFCQFFTRGCIRDDEDDFPKQLKEVKEMENWQFMFIDRQVYDFMTSHVDKNTKGDHDFGRKEILTLLGFEFVREDVTKKGNKCYDPTRYKYIWKYGEKEFQSDGSYLHCGKELIYNFKHLLNLIPDFPEDKKWIGEKAGHQIWEYLKPKTQQEKLSYILTGEHYSSMGSFLDDFTDEQIEQLLKVSDDETVSPDQVAAIKRTIEKTKKKNSSLQKKYLADIKTFGQYLSDLVSMLQNFHPMSGHFAPYVNYLTPQCGEHRMHQTILEKFAEINKTYIEEYEEDDEE